MNKRLIPPLLLTVALRLAAVFFLGRNTAPLAWEYDILAKNILSGKGYLIAHLNTYYKALGYPLYPFISAFIYSFTNTNYFALELLNVALSAFVCYFAYAIGKRVFGEKAGLAAAFLVALHPGLIVYATELHELTLVVFFICLGFWYMFFSNPRALKSDIALGAILGFGMLLRPILLFFLPVALLYKKAMRSALIIGTISLLIIAPWLVRNYMVHRQWTFISTSPAEHFWRGNNPFASGTSLTRDKKDMFEVSSGAFIAQLYALDEIGQYNLFYSEAKKFVRKDLKLFFCRTARKLYYFWWFSPQTGALYRASWKYLYACYYVPLVFFFFVGLFTGLRLALMRPYLLSLCLFMAFVSLMHSLYYTETRHRWMIEPLMIIIASYGIIRVKAWFSSAKLRP